MTEKMQQEITENYHRVLQDIQKAALRAGRTPKDICLVVVSKHKSVEVIEAAIQAGARVFGENYPELAIPKIEEIGPRELLEWHMIGHLQSRKSALVVEHFSLMHSLDSVKLANKLNIQLSAHQRQLRVLIEVNLSREDSKAGWPAWDESKWSLMIRDFEKIIELPGLKVEGLMTMPPLSSNPEDNRLIFIKMRKLQERLMLELGEPYWRDLSMGTSHDYLIAIEEGARYIRIGQAILGIRERLK